MSLPPASSVYRMRPTPGLRQSTLLIASFLFWLGFGLLIGAVELSESKENLVLSASLIVLTKFMVSFIPLGVVNALLAYWFWHSPDKLLMPKMMFMIPVGLLVLGLPLVTFIKTVILQLFEAQSLSKVIESWLNYPAFYLWLTLCYLLFNYTVQVTYAIWRRSALKQVELIAAESERVALRLHLLQGQLKPHFLFNALNSIGALVRGDDRPLAGHALRQLHGLLSYVVGVGKEELSSVGHEMGFVRDYVEMQRLRFGERMVLSWDIEDEDWYSIACAPLLFQPLIENAIHHGVEPHHEVCQLQISLRLREQKVQLEIRNSMPDSTEPSRGFGLGLSTTRERMALMYGAQAILACQRYPLNFVAELSFPAESRALGSVAHPRALHQIEQTSHHVQSKSTGSMQ